MSNYYVYVILDHNSKGNFKFNEIEFDYIPVYIGKGKNKRHEEHFKNYSLRFISRKNELFIKGNCISRIIEDNLTEEEAFKKERYFIELLGREDLNKGTLLNLTSGGQGVSGYKYTEIQLLERSKIQSLENNGFYNKKHNSNSFNEFKRPIYQIDPKTNEILNKFESLSDASSKTNSDPNKIREVANGNRKTHNNFIWKDADLYIKKRKSKNNSTCKRKIFKLNLENEILNEFESISLASRETGILKSNIIGCLNDRKRTAGGFKWRYKDDKH